MISSTQNPQVKEWMKLKNKKHRQVTSQFLIEGEHLVTEALQQGRLERLIKSEKYQGSVSFEKEIMVSQAVAQKLSDTQSKSDIFGIASIDQAQPTGTKWLFLNKVQDPGNVGTLIRSAASFGFETLFYDQDSADVYSDKVVRSTQGALFYINCVQATFEEVLSLCEERNIIKVGTYLDEQSSSVMPTDNLCLFLGHEGSGLELQYKNRMDYNALVKTKQFESLNVAIAGSILMSQSIR